MWRRDSLLHWTCLRKFWGLSFVYSIYFIWCLTSFFSIDRRLWLLCTVLMLFHLTDEVQPICWYTQSTNFNSVKPFADMCVLGDLNVHHKDYSCGTDRLGYLCYNFLISNVFTQMVNFPTQSLSMTVPVLLFWIYFFLWALLVFGLQWFYPH